jgi:hypothetical protein
VTPPARAQSPESEIALRLAAMWSAESELDAERVRFIDTTFSDPSATELARLIAEASHPDRDGLLELLFAPDEPHQIAIEPILVAAMECPDEAEVARLLARELDRIRFRLPEGRGTIEVELSAALAESFVRRLYLSRRIPAQLVAAMQQAMPDDRDRLRAGVVLRNSGLRFTPARIALVRRLIEGAIAADPAFPDFLAFALETLKSAETGEELWEFLSARKRRLGDAMEHAQRRSDRLARDGFEVVRSRGPSPAWVDPTCAERELRFLDRLALAVFDRIPHAGADRLEAAFDVLEPADPQPE